MSDKSVLTQYELLLVIVNYGRGSRVLRVAKQSGVQGGTILWGHGTNTRPWLRLLELAEIRKEIVIMIAPRAVVSAALKSLNDTFKFSKRNNGIAYVMPVNNFFGTGNRGGYYEDVAKGGINMTIYQAIFTIVEKGCGFKVVEAANAVGAKGATIVNARGSGVHETEKIFSFEIEPEKELVLIIAKKENTEKIVAKIREDLAIDQPGSGIIFVQEVHQTIGIRE